MTAKASQSIGFFRSVPLGTWIVIATLIISAFTTAAVSYAQLAELSSQTDQNEARIETLEKSDVVQQECITSIRLSLEEIKNTLHQIDDRLYQQQRGRGVSE